MVELVSGVTLGMYPNVPVYVDPTMKEDTVLIGRKSGTPLLSAINSAANSISNASRKGSANFVVVSPKVLSNYDRAKIIREQRKKKLDRILGLTLTSKNVQVADRKINATWSREAAEDLMNFGRISVAERKRRERRKKLDRIFHNIRDETEDEISNGYGFDQIAEIESRLINELSKNITAEISKLNGNNRFHI
jgi:hypothetical protein